MRQAIGLGAAMLPMSSLALLMLHDISRLFPRSATQLAGVFLGAILVMEIVGPFAVAVGPALRGRGAARGSRRHLAHDGARAERSGELIADAAGIPRLGAPHLRRRAGADGAQHARLQPGPRRAGPARAARQDEAARRGEARDHREHDRDQLIGEHAPRRAARGAAHGARRDRGRGRAPEHRHRRRRRASVPPVAGAAHLSHGALPARLQPLRLPRQAVHGVRPAHPHRSRERGRRRVPHARAGALHSALHRAVGLVAVLAGRGHVVRDLAAARGVGFPAVGPDAAGAHLERVRPLLRRDGGLRNRREHEGLLLGHPPQARVRHHRDPRLRHAAHRGRRRAARRLRADARRAPARASRDRSGRAAIPRVRIQPLPGVPLRLRGAARRPAHPFQRAAARAPAGHARSHRARRGRASTRASRSRRSGSSRRRSRTTRTGCASATASASRCRTWCGSRRCAGRKVPSASRRARRGRDRERPRRDRVRRGAGERAAAPGTSCRSTRAPACASATG